MAKGPIKNAFLSVNAVDLSDHVETLELTHNGEAVDLSAMGDGTRIFAGGLLNWELTVNWRQDYDAAKVDATIFALVGATTALILRPDTGVVAPTNPQFTGTGLVTGYSPIVGTVGDAHDAPNSFVSASALVRATS